MVDWKSVFLARQVIGPTVWETVGENQVNCAEAGRQNRFLRNHDLYPALLVIVKNFKDPSSRYHTNCVNSSKFDFAFRDLAERSFRFAQTASMSLSSVSHSLRGIEKSPRKKTCKGVKTRSHLISKGSRPPFLTKSLTSGR